MPDLNIDADFEVDVYITRRNATTRAVEAATGLTSVLARFALTPDGAAIGSTSTALTEAGTTARYVGTMNSATLVTDLAAYEHHTVYLVASKSGDFDRAFAEYVVRRRESM